MPGQSSPRVYKSIHRRHRTFRPRHARPRAVLYGRRCSPPHPRDTPGEGHHGKTIRKYPSRNEPPLPAQARGQKNPGSLVFRQYVELGYIPFRHLLFPDIIPSEVCLPAAYFAPSPVPSTNDGLSVPLRETEHCGPHRWASGPTIHSRERQQIFHPQSGPWQGG